MRERYNPLMAICIRPDCDSQIEPDYAFCPWCGTDNRPPGQRLPVEACAHQYIRRRYYCVLCGESRGWQRRPRLFVGFALLTLALFFGVVTFTVATATSFDQGWARSAASFVKPLLAAIGWSDPGRTSMIIASSLATILLAALSALVLIKRPMGAYMEDVKSWRAPWRHGPDQDGRPSIWDDQSD